MGKVIEQLGMKPYLAGQIYATSPGCRGAVVPLCDWRRANECFTLFKERSPFIALGRRMYCILRAPEAV
eukprot:1292933-Alexandrium_andersonii.AAC.1